MKQKVSSKHKRNLIPFEAPLKLSEETKRIAERKMVSTSVICRQALNNYILADNEETIYGKYPQF